MLKGNPLIMDMPVRPKKRLFVGLLFAALLALCLLSAGVWLISFSGLSAISQYLPLIIGLGLFIVLFVAAFSVAGTVLAILGYRSIPGFENLIWTAVNLLFPLAIRIGRLFDLEKERVERSFIEVSNHLVKQKRFKVKPEHILILTPHCIQHEDCLFKVTREPSNCKRCGRCQVKELLELTERYGTKLAIVTGGTLARKRVKEIRPKAIIAIACERDLTSGIQDVFPLPVLGILNQRPYGPCCNTRVDMSIVEDTIRQFLY